MRSDRRWKRAADKTIASLDEQSLLDQSTVLLIGSMARDTAGPDSDIDLLVVSPKRGPRLSTAPDVQVFSITRSEFVDRLKCGDDFPHWAVRFGRAISDRSHWWDELQQNPALRTWPDWRRKRRQTKKRLRFATPLLKSGDYDHAREELFLAARHLGRAILLKERVFPLSQPELPAQLRDVDHIELAGLLDSLVDEAAQPDKLKEAELVLSAILEDLEE